jgi:rhodanese-related sulfurtransferase
MTTKRLLLHVILLLGMTLLASCGGAITPTSNSESGSPDGAPRIDDVGEQVSVSGGSYTRILPTELQTMLKDEAIVLVNTHIPFEGNIPETDLSIPYNEIDQNLNRLPADKNARIVLYCRSGPMSAEAAETLVGLGYTNLWDLEGGMIAWQEAGLPLEGVS